MEKQVPITNEVRIAHVLQAQKEMLALEAEGKSYLAAPSLEQVILDNMGLVNLIATRDLRSFTFNPAVGLDEMQQQGRLAISGSVRTFDPEKGSFGTYMQRPVNERCIRIARELLTFPYVPAHAQQAYFAALRVSDVWGARYDTDAEFMRDISDPYNFGVAALANVYSAKQQRAKVEYDTPSIEANDAELMDRYYDEWDERFEATPRQFVDTSQDEMFDRALDVEAAYTRPEMVELRRRLDLLKSVNPRMHRVIESRIMYPVDQAQPTLEMIGAELGLTRERVRQLEVKGLELLRDEDLMLDYASRIARRGAGEVARTPRGKLEELNASPEEFGERLALLAEIDQRLVDVVKLRFLDGERKTQKEVARIMKCSLSFISNLEKRAFLLLANPKTLKYEHTEAQRSHAILEQARSVQRSSPVENGARLQTSQRSELKRLVDSHGEEEFERRLALLKQFNPWLATVVSVCYLDTAGQERRVAQVADMLGVSEPLVYNDKKSAIWWLTRVGELEARVRTIDTVLNPSTPAEH